MHFEVWIADAPEVNAIVRATRMYSARLIFLNRMKLERPGLSFNGVRARRLDPVELAELGSTPGPSDT